MIDDRSNQAGTQGIKASRVLTCSQQTQLHNLFLQLPMKLQGAAGMMEIASFRLAPKAIRRKLVQIWAIPRRKPRLRAVKTSKDGVTAEVLAEAQLYGCQMCLQRGRRALSRPSAVAQHTVQRHRMSIFPRPYKALPEGPRQSYALS